MSSFFSSPNVDLPHQMLTKRTVDRAAVLAVRLVKQKHDRCNGNQDTSRQPQVKRCSCFWIIRRINIRVVHTKVFDLIDKVLVQFKTEKIDGLQCIKIFLKEASNKTINIYIYILKGIFLGFQYNNKYIYNFRFLAFNQQIFFLKKIKYSLTYSQMPKSAGYVTLTTFCGTSIPFAADGKCPSTLRDIPVLTRPNRYQDVQTTNKRSTNAARRG